MTDQTVDDLRDYESTVPKVYIALAWLWVAVPFGYGVYELMLRSANSSGESWHCQLSGTTLADLFCTKPFQASLLAQHRLIALAFSDQPRRFLLEQRSDLLGGQRILDAGPRETGD